MIHAASLVALVRRSRMWPLLFLLAGLSALAQAQTQREANGGVLVTTINGVIGVSTTRQIDQAIQRANEQQAVALIVQLDTPGGLVTSTRDIIKAMVASPVPIVIYVAPCGARAASAGTFITYAAHIAAMAPGTNLGAATPIEIGGLPGMPQRQPDQQKNEKESSAASSQAARERKAVNDAVAMLRSLAQLRGRNAEWAEKAVREAATLTSAEALKEGVIDVVASSVDDLRAQIDGRKVSVGGAERTLATRNAAVTVFEADWRTRALSIISDPNIAFILLMIGFYGVILEFWNPGALVPGVIGGISLLLALTGLSALPVHYGALALLVLGIALMAAEAFTPGIGVLGIGGLAAFLVGSIFLFDAPGADIEIVVSLPLIVGAAVTTALLIFGIVAAAMKARERPPAAGAEQLIGMRGEVVDWDGEKGRVRANGEIWAARGGRALQAGDAVRVVSREGLTLVVERS
ncbi:MAG: nodulation protein NfeD [Xanthobacteraceae bacterium]